MAKPHRANHKHKVKVSTERSEHLNAGSSPALEGLQGQGTESLVGTGQSPVGVNFLFDFAHKKWAEPQ